jgi:hypothetical protein
VYAAKKNLDIEVINAILNEAHESDEASGPEEGSGESFYSWKERMAVESESDVTSRSSLDGLEFLEVIEPEWRSELVRDWIIFYRLY